MSPSSPRGLYLTGTYRSGSSWLAAILATAPGVGWLDEPFGPKMGGCYSRVVMPMPYAALPPDDEAAWLRSVAALLTFRGPRLPAPALWRSRRALRRWWNISVRLAAYRRAGKQIPLIKQPTGVFLADWLARRFALRVIVLVRHPAAYANSCKKRGWQINFARWLTLPGLDAVVDPDLLEETRAFVAHPGDLIDYAALAWKIAYGSARALGAQHPDWLTVRHEQLALDPPGTAEALFAALGLPFAEATAAFVRASSQGDDPSVPAERQWKSLHRDSKQAATQWQRELTADEIGRIEQRVADIYPHYYPNQSFTGAPSFSSSPVWSVA